MPTISVEKADLLHLIGKHYSLEELEGQLDYVKGEIKGYSPETDELKIELKDTNRPDLWCPEGIARQLRFRHDTPDYSSLLHAPDARSDKQVVVDEQLQTIRPYIGAFVAKGVAVSEQFLIQMIQTQEKLCDGYGKKRELIAIGIYNADKIVFPVHYRAVKPDEIRFVPLGCEKEMDLAEILAQHPKGQEFAPILDGLERYPILHDDRDDVLSFPPVINSRSSGEVRPGDDCLFIEITGMDLDMTLHAVNILAYNFKDRGFEIEPVTSVYPNKTRYGQEVISPYPLRNEVTLECGLVEQYLGGSYRPEEIEEHLQKYGLAVERQSEERALKVSSYPYRQDYMHPVDAVEDCAISIGFNAFEPIMPERFTVGHLQPQTLFEDRIRETMIGFGFEEVILNILSNKEDFNDRMLGMYAELLDISNPMNENYSALRNSLIPALLKVEANSSKSIYPHKVFEVGETAVKDEQDNHGWKTMTKLAAAISHAEANFSELGSYLAHLQYLMGWDARIQAKELPIFIPGRSGEIVVDETTAGIIGEIHPAVLEKWGIKMPSAIFELDLSNIIE